MLDSGRCYGLVVGVFGVVCVSPDACLMRIAQSVGADISMLVFWKSLFKYFILMGVLSAAVGLPKASRSIRNGPWYFFIGALLMGGLEVSFAAMILLTTAARALLFYSLNPLMSAVIGRILLGDELKPRSIAALIFATAAVFLTFAPGLIGHATEAGASIEGDMCGIAAGMCQSSFICLVRYVHRKDPEMTLVPSAAAGSLVSIMAVALASHITGTTLLPDADASLQFFGAVAGSGLGVAILLVCLNIAPRTLSGAEVSLVTLLETILGPFFIFLWFGETPGPWTLAGGALLFVTLVLHEATGMFDRHYVEDVPQAAVHASVDNESAGKFLTGRRDPEVELSTCL